MRCANRHLMPSPRPGKISTKAGDIAQGCDAYSPKRACGQSGSRADLADPAPSSAPADSSPAVLVLHSQCGHASRCHMSFTHRTAPHRDLTAVTPSGDRSPRMRHLAPRALYRIRLLAGIDVTLRSLQGPRDRQTGQPGKLYMFIYIIGVRICSYSQWRAGCNLCATIFRGDMGWDIGPLWRRVFIHARRDGPSQPGAKLETSRLWR
ncbi:hypothetical protein BS50DRAFT_152536 [Corynespora cassiicola Philippines]|uniref:Uncharacterized protein n=1 Tax=Corynespora cassiicola Philippines TaxID=1448308 RepID=A0A2T2N7T9_CORCC|nr:hypothetical protein BS50DRAFT_152536 [Corynespora cassiicola Philippines]